MIDKDEALLWGLLNKVQLFEAENVQRLHGVWYEFPVGIGADHTAYITMAKEDYDELVKRNK